MYSFETIVGYSQTDTKRKMTIPAIVDSFQDCSCFHSEELGIGFEYLVPNQLVWILNSWQIEIKQYPRFYDKIKIATFTYDFKGFFGFRNFFIENESGDKIVTANSVWTLMDWEKKCPAHMPQLIKDAYSMEEKLPMEYKSRKIKLPNAEDCIVIRKEPVEIIKDHLDSNRHVNNGQYIRIAINSLDEEDSFKSLQAEYRKQAFLGDTIIPVIYIHADTYTVALCDSNEIPYAIIELK